MVQKKKKKKKRDSCKRRSSSGLASASQASYSVNAISSASASASASASTSQTSSSMHSVSASAAFALQSSPSMEAVSSASSQAGSFVNTISAASLIFVNDRKPTEIWVYDDDSLGSLRPGTDLLVQFIALDYIIPGAPPPMITTVAFTSDVGAASAFTLKGDAVVLALHPDQTVIYHSGYTSLVYVSANPEETRFPQWSTLPPTTLAAENPKPPAATPTFAIKARTWQQWGKWAPAVLATSVHCCFIKMAEKYGVTTEAELNHKLPKNTMWVLYTTMEPCNERLSGNRTCVERILALREVLKTVYFGIEEPGTFIADNRGRERLEAAGVTVIQLQGMEARTREVSLAGHQ
ncbi:hypothetical protein PG996_013750 [Apiospora saccharicola]|uniref:CMP/dCMP-type deaminase domain-containing protein n=1 Tax=Apiospora saccharicola TaxID=335842 RepID=A0ABR1TGC4_9PEZI